MLITLIITFIVLLFLGMPVAFAMLVGGVFAAIAAGDLPSVIAPSKLFVGLNSFPLMAVPYFILAGEVMNRGGITARIVALADALVGHLRGGLGHVTVVAEMLLSGVSGSAAADASALGAVTIPAMVRAGYRPEFAVGLTAAASTMGPIIPPSILMVIYGSVTGISVGALFLGGIIPVILMGLSLMVMVYYYAHRHGYRQVAARVPLSVVGRRFMEAFWALFTGVIVIGGILSGVFTATESGALACVYALFVGIYVYKELRWRDLPELFVNAAIVTGVSMIVVATGELFGFILARAHVAGSLVSWMTAVSTDPTIVWCLIIILLLLIGVFVEPLPAMLIFIPVMMPLVKLMKYDDLHFALVFLMLVCIGAITPPVGLLLYISCAIGKVPVARVLIWPFVWALTVVILLTAFIPSMVTVVPNLVLRK
jgi:tripartite ATP-independent transporter DctM subunit